MKVFHPPIQKEEDVLAYFIKIAEREYELYEIETSFHKIVIHLKAWKSHRGKKEDVAKLDKIFPREVFHKALPRCNIWVRAWAHLGPHMDEEDVWNIACETYERFVLFCLGRKDIKYCSEVLSLRTMFDSIVRYKEHQIKTNVDLHDIRTVKDVLRLKRQLKRLVKQGVVSVGWADKIQELLKRKRKFMMA